MNRVTNNKPTTVNLWQQNLNKFYITQQDPINSINPNRYDITILQEPSI